MPKKYMFQYIINGKLEIKFEPVYHFEWTVNGGTGTFGMHGTLAEWQTKLEKLEENDFILLVSQKFVPPEKLQEINGEEILRQCPFCLTMPHEKGNDGTPLLTLVVHTGVAFVECGCCLSRGSQIDRSAYPTDFRKNAIIAWNKSIHWIKEKKNETK